MSLSSPSWNCRDTDTKDSVIFNAFRSMQVQIPRTSFQTKAPILHLEVGNAIWTVNLRLSGRVAESLRFRPSSARNPGEQRRDFVPMFQDINARTNQSVHTFHLTGIRQWRILSHADYRDPGIHEACCAGPHRRRVPGTPIIDYRTARRRRSHSRRPRLPQAAMEGLRLGKTWRDENHLLVAETEGHRIDAFCV